MRDEQEILGKWILKFRQWTWEYHFSENKTVTWRDIYNNQGGSGQWVKTSKLINIRWYKSSTKESWYLPINPDKQEGWIDAHYGVGKFSATRIEKVTPGDLDFDFKVSPAVPKRHQGSNPVCWAAGVSMMIAWRNNAHSMTTDQAIDSMGRPFVQIYGKKRELSQETYHDEFPDGDYVDMKTHFTLAARLKNEPLRSYTPKQLYELMARHRSPLLTETHFVGLWTHYFVITRIYGSGGMFNTSIVYNDPLDGGENEDNMDSFIQKLEAAVDLGNMQLWHY